MEERDVHLALALGCTVPDAQRYRANADALRTIHDVWAMEPGTMTKFASPGMMDLVIERLTDEEASLSHYGEQNGDLMADPDMVLELAAGGSWVRAVTFRNDYFGYDRNYRDGQDRRGQRLANEYLSSWLGSIRAEGYRLKERGA
jgi:hypothetical protein